MKRILTALLLSLCANLPANEISTWSSPPEIISSEGIDASNPRVGMDANGNSVGVWLEEDVVVSKSLPLGGSWSSSTALSSTGSSNPGLVVDPAGNATAIWLESGVVKTATKPFGSSWGSATTLSSSGSSSPQISGDPSGNAVAVWVRGGVIETATQLFGMSWSSVDTISDVDSDSPQVSIGLDGTVVAVWHSVNGITSINNINSATKQISGAWASSTIVSDPAVESVNPQVGVDSTGSAVAVWFSYIPSGLGFTNVILQTATLPLAGSWSTPLNLSDPGAMDPADLFAMIIVGDDDKMMAIWTQSFDGTNFTLQSSLTNNKLIWAPATTIDQSLYSFAADAADNSNKNVFALYMFRDTNTSSTIINATEATLEGFANPFWVNEVTISDGANNAYPRIATGITGGTGPGNCYATALWANYNGTNTNVSSSLGTGILVAPPTSVAVIQNVNDYGVFQEYYNTLSWTDSTAPNVTGYVIYRNDVVINFVGPAIGQFIDNNRKQNGPTVYGVAATDNTGTQSPIVTVEFP